MKIRDTAWIHRLRFVVPLLFFLLTVLVFLSLDNQSPEIPFVRAPIPPGARHLEYFNINPYSGSVLFQDSGRFVPLDDVYSTSGAFLKVTGEHTFSVSPHLTGSVGIFGFLFIQANDQEIIELNITIQRKSKSVTVFSLRTGMFSDLINASFSMDQEDELIFTFRGRGIAALSPPVMFKKSFAEEPNHVFVIAADTFRHDHIGKIVNGLPLTPNIDHFKKDSVSFENCYAQSSWTLSSFMSLFTGLYEYNHQVTRHTNLDQKKPYLISPLTQKFVTFNLNGGTYVGKHHGFSRDFDYFFSDERSLQPDGGKIIFERALGLLDRLECPQTFFFLHTYQTHAPYTPPAEFLHKLDSNPKYYSLTSIPFGHHEKIFQPVAENHGDQLALLYQAEVLAFDTFFGQFVQALKDRNIYHQSMIIFLSDHGEEFFDHGGWDHGHSLYNELIKVPLIIKFPHNVHFGTTVSQRTGIIDVLPTILTFFDLRFPERRIDGHSLLPAINGRRQQRILVSSLGGCSVIPQIPTKIALLSGPFKIIYNTPFSQKQQAFFASHGPPPQVGEFEIFNLETDRAEQHNIIEEEHGLLHRYQPLFQKILKKIRRQALEKPPQPLLQKVDKDALKSLGYLDQKDSG